MKVVLLLLLCVALCVVNASNKKVVRADLHDYKQVGVIDSWGLDVWSRDSLLDLGLNDFVVNEDQLNELVKLGVSYNVLINDLDEHLAQGQRDLELSRHSDAAMADFFIAYHTYDEFVTYFQNITSVYSSISKYTPSIGTTIEGRNIFGITVTGTATGTKKKIFISGGQHAREWIAPATVTYIITQLLTQYSSNAAVKAVLDSTIFYFVPLVNVDGYVYTWTGTSNRLWRKNRRLNTGGSYGVDLNRNWNDHWGGEGSSGTPSSDTYRGTAPFSEPETKAVSNYAIANKPFAGAIDYHSYSQLIMRPYGWTTTPPPNDAAAKSIGDTMRARVLAINNVPYTSQAGWELYYTSGGARDWQYSENGVPYSFTIELRDTGTYGFQLPANQIKPTGAENWNAFLYFAQTV